MAGFKERLTPEGHALLTDMLMNGTRIEFTKIVLGDGNTTDAEITTLNDVVSPKVTLDIFSVTKNAYGQVSVTGIFDNNTIMSGFYYREKGIYATDGTNEILFSYGNCGNSAEYIDTVSLSSEKITKRVVSVYSFNDTDNVNIVMQDGIYATHEDIVEVLDAVTNIRLDGDWAKYSQAEQIINDTDQIKNSIGEESDSINKATIFGLGNKIISLINGVSNAFVQFRNALTDARAANLDKLDVYVSSRYDKVTTDTIKTNIGSTADTVERHIILATNDILFVTCPRI